ncbi:MAG: cell wall-binding repeat-containing protein [Firmicutes bacterium]|nr:cell wall-binding repeat-containing protein [Bacillota bacterium]
MKRYCTRSISLLLSCLLAFTALFLPQSVGAESASLTDGGTVSLSFPAADHRLAGTNRYETALAIADKLLPETERSFDNIVIASGVSYPDALSGSYLASVKQAPLLLVEGSTEIRILQYVHRRLSPGGTVYLLGGTGSVSARFENLLQQSGLQVARLGGKNRYDTNYEILKAAGVTEQDMLLCSGENFADCLSASALGMPIFLVPGTVSREILDNYRSLHPRKVTVVGGTGSVAEAAVRTLRRGGGYSFQRLGGKNRYETSALIARHFANQKTADQEPSALAQSGNVVIADGRNFPDGLCGGPLAWALQAPLLLVDPEHTALAHSYMTRYHIRDAYILGGNGSIGEQTVRNLGEQRTLRVPDAPLTELRVTTDFSNLTPGTRFSNDSSPAPEGFDASREVCLTTVFQPLTSATHTFRLLQSYREWEVESYDPDRWFHVAFFTDSEDLPKGSEELQALYLNGGATPYRETSLRSGDPYPLELSADETYLILVTGTAGTLYDMRLEFSLPGSSYTPVQENCQVTQVSYDYHYPSYAFARNYYLLQPEQTDSYVVLGEFPVDVCEIPSNDYRTCRWQPVLTKVHYTDEPHSVAVTQVSLTAGKTYLLIAGAPITPSNDPPQTEYPFYILPEHWVDITGVDVIYDRFRNRADVLHYELTAPADGDYLLWIEGLQLPDGGSVSSTFLSAIVKPDSAGYVYNYTHGRYRETAAPDRLEEGLTEYLQEGSAIPIKDAQAGARYHIWLFGIQGNQAAPSFRLTVTLQP